MSRLAPATWSPRSLTLAVSGGMTVIVRHAVPVTLDLGGQTVALNVVGKSVADALVAAGVDPAANPAVTPGAHRQARAQT